MNEKYLNDLIRYRMEQAFETLKEARILFEKASLRGSINRAYYAMFYAVLALLATKKLGTSKHSGAIALFDREFVKAGLFEKKFSKALHLAFEQRQMHDYGEITEISKNDVSEILTNAEDFLQATKNFLMSGNFI